MTNQVRHIATICGTMKLAADMQTMAEELTRQGYLVFMPHVRKGRSRLATPSPITEAELDAMHRVKIELADLVVFVTQEKKYVWGDTTGSSELYFGESTRAEFKYAEQLQKSRLVARMIRHNYKDRIVWISPDEIEAMK